jgi:hypothetical protein
LALNLAQTLAKSAESPLSFPPKRRSMSTEYRNFLALSYEELEELNLEAKADRSNRVAPTRSAKSASST